MANYAHNALEDLTALWKIFVPVAIIQFSVMPMHLRVPFTATAGFFWCGILSWMRGSAISISKKGQVHAGGVNPCEDHAHATEGPDHAVRTN